MHNARTDRRILNRNPTRWYRDQGTPSVPFVRNRQPMTPEHQAATGDP
jgi:hypothetical protein